jgi:hypothetical protein
VKVVVSVARDRAEFVGVKEMNSWGGGVHRIPNADIIENGNHLYWSAFAENEMCV